MDVQQIISEISRLPLDEQKRVIETVSANLKLTADNKIIFNAPPEDLCNRQLAWLKANRHRYAGQYVALVGDELVGHGATLTEVRKQARARRHANPFITKVFAEETVVSGG